MSNAFATIPPALEAAFTTHGYRLDRLLYRDATRQVYQAHYLPSEGVSGQGVSGQSISGQNAPSQEERPRRRVAIDYFADPATQAVGLATAQEGMRAYWNLEIATVQRAIAVLSGRNLPGYAIVRDLRPGTLLTHLKSYRPRDIQHLTWAVLGCLCELQARIPPVVHGDLHPAAILIDPSFRVWLAPPGLHQSPDCHPNPLTRDLGDLGLTLVGILMGWDRATVRRWIARAEPLQLDDQLPQIARDWLAWLERLVTADPERRFADARTALAAIQGVDILRLPAVSFVPSELHTRVDWLGDRPVATVTAQDLTQSLDFNGRWEMALHPSDPPAPLGRHAWIEVQGDRRDRHHLAGVVHIDSQRLQPGRTYRRSLLFYVDGRVTPYAVPLTVRVRWDADCHNHPPYGFLAMIFLFFWAGSATVVVAEATAGLVAFGGFGLGMAGSFAAQMRAGGRWTTALLAGLVAAIAVLGGVTPAMALRFVLSFVVGVGIWASTQSAAGHRLLRRRFYDRPIAIASILTVLLGIVMGVGCGLGLTNPLVVAGSLLLGLPLAFLLAHLVGRDRQQRRVETQGRSSIAP
jgi:hypothetical protein